MTLIPGQWYRDAELDAYFKVLGADALTVTVLDQYGNRRQVNRLLFERDCVPVTKVPALIQVAKEDVA